MACAAYGADVTFTDKADVMAHLEANVTNNFKGEEAVLERLQFIPFSWGTDPVAAGLSPPYSIVLATDVVYMRSQINPLIDALLSLSDSKSTIVVAIERRDEALWTDFQHALKAACRVRRVPVRRMASRIEDEDEAEDEEGNRNQGAAESLGILSATSEIAHRRRGTRPRANRRRSTARPAGGCGRSVQSHVNSYVHPLRYPKPRLTHRVVRTLPSHVAPPSITSHCARPHPSPDTTHAFKINPYAYSVNTPRPCPSAISPASLYTHSTPHHRNHSSNTVTDTPNRSSLVTSAHL